MGKIITIQFRRSRLPRRLLRDGWWLESAPTPPAVVAFPRHEAPNGSPNPEIKPKIELKIELKIEPKFGPKAKHLTLVHPGKSNHVDRDYL